MLRFGLHLIFIFSFLGLQLHGLGDHFQEAEQSHCEICSVQAHSTIDSPPADFDFRAPPQLGSKPLIHDRFTTAQVFVQPKSARAPPLFSV